MSADKAKGRGKAKGPELLRPGPFFLSASPDADVEATPLVLILLVVGSRARDEGARCTRYRARLVRVQR